MEVAGLALAIPPILAGFMKIVKSVDDIRTKYKTIPSSMDTIAAYCGMVHVAMLHLKSQQFQEALLSVPETTAQTMEHVEVLLLGCKGVLCQIEAHTLQFAIAAEKASVHQRPGLDILQLTRLVWKEPEVKDLLAQLRDYKSGIDTIRQICMSQSLESIQTQLSRYTPMLDILLERSRQSWNKDPPLILASRPESLRFSFISHTSRFSTTALYINQDHDRQSTTAFDFDYEVVNSRIYKHAMADEGRRASIAAFRASVADSLHVPEEHGEDNLESVREERTDQHTRGVTEAWDTPTQEPQLIGSTENLKSPLETPKHVRGASEGRVYHRQWPLDDRQPGIVKNFSRPGRSIESPSKSPSTSPLIIFPSVISPSTTSPSVTSPSAISSSVTSPSTISPSVISPSTTSPSVTSPSTTSPSVTSPSTTSPSVASPSPSTTKFATKFPREYKIAVIGGGGVDKSSSVIQLIQSHFMDEYDPTINNCRKMCVIDDEVALLDVLHTAGQEVYSAMREQYMRSSDGFVLVYSITSRSSFEEISTFQQQILRAKDKDYFPMIVVGNHRDREDEREVSSREGLALARGFDCQFVEASSEGRINVDVAFYNLVRDIRKYERLERELNALRKPFADYPVLPAKRPSTSPSDTVAGKASTIKT